MWPMKKLPIEKRHFLETCDAAVRAEQWTVNKAVH